MRRRNIVVLVIVLVAVALLIILKPKSNDKAKAAQAQKPANAGPVGVTAVVVKPQRLSNDYLATGNVQANESVSLKSEVTGRIQHIYFKEGTKVTKGQLLVKLNDADLQAQLQKLKSSEKLNEDIEYRQKKLLDIQGISQQEYETSVNQLNSVRADIGLVQAQIAKTELRAPFNGTVGIRNVSEGSYVSPNDVIATVQQVDPVKIDFTVPERYAELVKPNAMVRFTVEGQRDTFKATVSALEPSIQQTTRELAVRAVCPNSSGKLLPGAFARVQLSLSESNNALLVPTQAVIPQLKGQTVYVVKQGKAVPQKIDIGYRSDTTVQVINGLNPNDTVIVTGIMQLKPQSPVKVRVRS